MKFQDIPADILTIRVRPVGQGSAEWRDQAVYSIENDLSRPDEFDLRLKVAMIAVQTVTPIDNRRLSAELAIGRALLAQLANRAADGSMELQIAFFSGPCLEMGELEIGVDDYAERAFAELEHRRNGPKGEQLYKLLERHFCFRQGDSDFFFLTAGPAIDEMLKPAPVPEEEVAEPEELIPDPESQAGQEPAPSDVQLARIQQPTRSNSFCISGDGLRFVATETPLPQGKSTFLTTRMTKARKHPDRALRLVKGKLHFADWSRAGHIRLLAKAQMTALTQDHVSYLRKWDEFGDLEGELLLDKARVVGVLHVAGGVENRDGTVAVRVTQASEAALKALDKGQVGELRWVEELPDYLLDPALRFKDFASGIEHREEREPAPAQEETQVRNRHYGVGEFDKASNTLKLKTERLPEKSGKLILSLAGEVAQIKRRLVARRMILEGRAANPQLGLLIEEKGVITQTRRPSPVKPLTAFVLNKVFKNTPTPKQLDAISCALETPDIALIQGPPGTGKTTVIAAILERLNEMADKRGIAIKGQVLLTGFQHDAVENMIERLSLNSLPVPKFGKRSNAATDDASLFEERLDRWCGKLATELRDRNPQIAEIEQETEIRHLYLQYLQTPTRVLAASLASRIAALGIAILGEKQVRQAENLKKKMGLEEKLNEASHQWRDVVRRLRCRPESFADDGPERAADALADLGEVLDSEDLALLDDASLWRNENGLPPFLQRLATLKRTLLARFSAPPIFRIEKANDEIVALADVAIKQIKRKGHSGRDKKSAALAEFLAQLGNNPRAMLEAVSDYSFAFAATCQQSVNRRMQFQKNIKGGDTNLNQQRLEYEYVIVDEAARVSPRDLMVPMAQGRRIILVGDHRQLPHIIDDEVARRMEDGENGPSETDWLKKSMFHYLFSERLKTLEEGDKITRRVTLDRQYRMHELLGDFISRNFYERFDPSEKFGSGRPAVNFAHALPDTGGKPAAWLEVPVEKGKHRRSGTSWIRPIEATVIVHQLLAWMNCAAGKDLTFGVISFYKAQADYIRQQLGTLGDNDKRLRIGTVDSFQGMEFDVVFLSTVRTVPQSWKPATDDREKQAQLLFGHLCLYNRLNVSMSRQKKLLVVVGDPRLLEGDLAAEFIPGLVDFHKLCREQGVVLEC
ncbi:AAA domain-containing protein [Pseudomonas sp. FP2335]|uniref:DEAD/DEAH box helicase n=1 Tax=Pseudomonas sp. FP2335 TaxID=2954092 RepID=UPI00273474EA|nr:AAA domain-containing protein [Pseudomonas sp. FP2335]WLH81777.1 AAA domain-containing protein [Pseudomonas sp. FP2335]